MNGLDFFQSSLLEDVSITDDVIFIPDYDLELLDIDYPFPLVIGNDGNEELALCTGRNVVAGVITTGLKVNRSFFDSTRIQTRVKGERVMCAPTIHYFKEVHSFLNLFLNEHSGLLSATMLVLTGGDLTDRVLNWNGSGNSFEVTGSSYSITVNFGTGICNKKIVSFPETKTLNFTSETSISNINHVKSVLCYVDEFNEVGLLFSNPGSDPSVPEIPDDVNAIPIASFRIFAGGMTGEGITDLRNL